MEPLLAENPNRFVLFPIQNDEVWQFYKKSQASFWTAEEIDLSQDQKDWNNLNDNERHFIKHVLAFSPAFVADCLETTIEVGEEFKELFEESGGVHWQLVPSLNSEPQWVNAVADMIRRN